MWVLRKFKIYWKLSKCYLNIWTEGSGLWKQQRAEGTQSHIILCESSEFESFPIDQDVLLINAVV